MKNGKNYVSSNGDNVSAIHYGNKKAEQICQKRVHADLRDKIIELFLAGNAPSAIGQLVDMPVNEGVNPLTVEGIIRRVVRENVPKNIRAKISGKFHREVILENADAVSEARREAFVEAGMFVWTQEEAEFLECLLRKPSFKKPETRQTRKKGKRQKRRICDIAKMVDALNTEFNVDKFTPELVRRKIERIRVQRKTKRNVKRSTEYFQQKLQALQDG